MNRPSTISPLLLCLLLPLLLLAAGCETETRVISTSFGFEPRSDQGNDRDNRSTRTASSDDRSTWTIALGEFSGDGHHERAQNMADQISAFAETDKIWVDRLSSRSTIYHGRYGSRNDPQAHTDLERWRSFVRNGQMRLPGLMLVPVNERSGSTSEFALETGVQRETARRQQLRPAQDPPKYTLHIGMYDEDFGSNFRQAAEDAVAALREDGWEAYFWHGPVRTTITVGLFDDQALDDGSEQTLQVQALRQHFPHNSLNGRSIRITSGGRTAEQRSELVELPRF